MSSDYRLSPALGARLMGLLLVLTAIVVFAATAAVALLNLHTVVLLVVAVALLVGVLTTGNLLRRTTVVHLDETGYRVRMIRAAGVKDATWKEVEDAGTASPGGIPCVVLHLTEGRTTTIPVQALAADRDDFVRDLRGHLQRGQGLTRLEDWG